jgi:SH3-like domain-containing protein
VLPARRTKLAAACAAGVLTLVSGAAVALDFMSVADPAVVMYDGPSKDSPKLFVLSRDYPVEVVITAPDGWVRVRDDSGAFGWVEARSLSNRRTVLVKAASEARQAPNDKAPVAFKADPGLILEFQGLNSGWAQVRHRDGASGYLKLSQLWGL